MYILIYEHRKFKRIIQKVIVAWIRNAYHDRWKGPWHSFDYIETHSDGPKTLFEAQSPYKQLVLTVSAHEPRNIFRFPIFFHFRQKHECALE
jgi:hypothetical protein